MFGKSPFFSGSDFLIDFHSKKKKNLVEFSAEIQCGLKHVFPLLIVPPIEYGEWGVGREVGEGVREVSASANNS